MFETILLALEYVTDTRLFKKDFNPVYRDYISEILQDCFELEKKHDFLVDANRPKLNKGKIMQSEDKIYTVDTRVEKTRVYITVLYEIPSSNLSILYKLVDGSVN
ncbi:hypothetical protein [Fervidibacillus halotolerans]|uniref:Uncharacterized protein n=1 Tax=Fervidibacillus halotolerans TaxID=2980027 RepID=A0A9E8LZJ8_9BACI|nr:hypothetical protein [Fervidibacillus halotolerans]WAA12456.1 hypothetical protein OE105_13150 [Fervidibacillus halotolerans]